MRARVLASASAELVGEDRQAFDAALTEYEALQASLADTAPAHLNLGMIHAATGRREQAVRDYETAVSLDPGFVPARLNLATLLNEMGRNPDAERVLRKTIERSPREGEPHYSLGLLLAEMNRLEDATVSLGRAAALLPSGPECATTMGWPCNNWAVVKPRSLSYGRLTGSRRGIRQSSRPSRSSTPRTVGGVRLWGMGKNSCGWCPTRTGRVSSSSKSAQNWPGTPGNVVGALISSKNSCHTASS